MPAATNLDPTTSDVSPDFRVAIIGGGITGINLALGLQARGVRYTLYERAPGFREIGAGIGFSPNAERAMIALDPAVQAAYKRSANPNGEDYFQWIDGHASDTLLYKLHVGRDGFQGGLRSAILEEWAKLVRDPDEHVRFGKTVDTITDGASDLTIHFSDGTTATADVVIGCDGIRSRVRQLILGSNSPAASPHYTSKYCYRALVPMEKAVAAIGEYKSFTRFMYNGPGAHIITYPVGGNTVLNVLAVLSDTKPWPDPTKHTAPGSKGEVTAAFEGWHPTVTKIAALFPEEMDKWAIFDMEEFPAPAYNKGRVAVAGDAAHATGPHLGAGGGLGIEDALVLAGLMEAVGKRVVSESGENKKALVEKALEVYNEVRYERTQAVVRVTRKACLLFHWQVPEVGDDGEKFGKAITPMFHKVWNYDVEGMVGDAVARLAAKLY
ncbi:salicylate hydroxylase [Echria macrotheca]|uniref:Salicylate hydroxylase n=1 Tax=Echria macrotheca TaxID=438768 RepID=A0AAJ0FCW7_9PEZI|nr:salicylate hydroxylase [Echria macrotheca]